MSDVNEAWEMDEEWFYASAQKLKKLPSDEQIERFCRMVNTAVVDGGVDLASARRISFGEVMA